MEYSNNNIGHFYKSVFPIVSTDIKYLEHYRHKEVQISRLRVGAANVNQRLFILKRHLNGLCNIHVCQVKETIHHLLLECSKEDTSELLRNKVNYKKMNFPLNTFCR